VQNPDGYTSMQTVRGTELYMSPILYQALKSGPDKGVNHNVFKSDVFSLGMCFLFASCLDYKCLYDMRKVKNMNDVKNVVNKFVDNKYSNVFSDALVLMLNLNEKERPDFIELSNMI
jgi:serine/threonine protein kinase